MMWHCNMPKIIELTVELEIQKVNLFIDSYKVFYDNTDIPEQI